MVLNKKLNKLILGTAQFGDTYGILNYGKKKLSRLVKNKILLKAKNRINIIDTAEDYNITQTKKILKILRSIQKLTLIYLQNRIKYRNIS